MQQQPLAFTLVKTVVLARDEARPLGPAMATAWEMLHQELSPAHRLLFDEVQWGPEYQEDLKHIIAGVRSHFMNDPALEQEFLAFLAEVPPYAEEEDQLAMPLLGLVSATGAASISDMTEVPIAEEPIDLTTIGQASETEESIDISEADVVAEAPIEVHAQTEESISLHATETHTSPEAPTFQGKIAEASAKIPDPLLSVAPQDSGQAYWPYALAAIVTLAIVVLAFMLFSSNTSSVQGLKAEEGTDKPIIKEDTLASDENSLTDANAYSLTSATTVTTHIVDSLRAAGNYQLAYSTQLQLVDRVASASPDELEHAEVLTELATLASANRQPLAALDAQREAIEVMHRAYGSTPLLLGRAHLRMARFYLDHNEPIMAHAHKLEAQQYFAQSSQAVSPADSEELEKVKSLLQQRS